MLVLPTLILLSYCVGSISSAIIISKMLGLSDPRDVGSGNPGATNVLRFAGKKAAAATLLGDAVKGVIPILIARELGVEAPALTAIGVAAFVGHLFPVFYGFRGGKGVATFVGVSLALNLWTGLSFIALWLLVAAVLRYSSLAALIATAASPAIAWVLGEPLSAVALFALMSSAIFWRHTGNIKNLLAGKEKKIGQKDSTEAPA
jgi:acyl phosphate:glycerol-3-phosphate acyltransferase